MFGRASEIENFPKFAYRFALAAAAEEGKTIPNRRQITASLRLLSIAINGLSDREYQAVMLQYSKEGLSQADLAVRLSVSLSTVWRDLRRARRHILGAIRYNSR